MEYKNRRKEKQVRGINKGYLTRIGTPERFKSGQERKNIKQ